MTAPDELWLDPIFDAVVSDVQACGYFDAVNEHEPKSAPGYGLHAAVWVQEVMPIALASGLAATSGRITFMVRMYSNMLGSNMDAIDRNMTKAMSSLMRRYHDDFDFDLTETVRNVDLLGQHGVELSAVAGYLDVAGTMYRIYDITVPVIVNDMWPQVS